MSRSVSPYAHAYNTTPTRPVVADTVDVVARTTATAVAGDDATAHVTLDNLEEEQDKWLRLAERSRAPARFLAAAAAAAAAANTTRSDSSSPCVATATVAMPLLLSPSCVTAAASSPSSSATAAPLPPRLTSPRSLRVCAAHGVDAARDLQKLSLEMHLHRVCGSAAFAAAVATQTSLPLCDAREAVCAFQRIGVGIGTTVEKRVAYTSYAAHEQRRVALLATLQAARHRLLPSHNGSPHHKTSNSNDNDNTRHSTAAAAAHWSALGVVRSVSRSTSHERYHSHHDHNSNGEQRQLQAQRRLPYTPRDAEALRVSAFGNRGVVGEDVSNPARVTLSYSTATTSTTSRHDHHDGSIGSSIGSSSNSNRVARDGDVDKRQHDCTSGSSNNNNINNDNNDSSNSSSRLVAVVERTREVLMTDTSKSSSHSGSSDGSRPRRLVAADARHSAPFLVRTSDVLVDGKATTTTTSAVAAAADSTTERSQAQQPQWLPTAPPLTRAEQAAGFVYYCANVSLPT